MAPCHHPAGNTAAVSGEESRACQARCAEEEQGPPSYEQEVTAATFRAGLPDGRTGRTRAFDWRCGAYPRIGEEGGATDESEL
jgi:hypothetical protein